MQERATSLVKCAQRAQNAQVDAAVLFPVANTDGAEVLGLVVAVRVRIARPRFKM